MLRLRVQVFACSDSSLMKNEAELAGVLAHEIVHVTGGTGTHVVDLARWELRPPHLCVIAPGQVHHWDDAHDLQGSVLLFTDGLVEERPELSAAEPSMGEDRRAGDRRQVERRSEERPGGDARPACDERDDRQLDQCRPVDQLVEQRQFERMNDILGMLIRNGCYCVLSLELFNPTYWQQDGRGRWEKKA